MLSKNFCSVSGESAATGFRGGRPDTSGESKRARVRTVATRSGQDRDVERGHPAVQRRAELRGPLGFLRSEQQSAGVACEREPRKQFQVALI
jgi:hypothetical protein